MNVSQPYLALCPSLDSRVLQVLAGTSRPLTGREVARLAGRTSHGGVLRVLNRLSEHGLVDRAEAGRALLFSLNREHLAAPAVLVLAGMREALLERVREAIGAWDPPPVHVSLFGSVARGDGDTGSDVDLFVVRPHEIHDEDPRWRAQRDDLALRIQRWTGNSARLAEMSEAELAELRRQRPPIVGELRADAIDLHGPPIAQLLGTER